MSDDKLSPEELQLAGKIHDKVIKFLTTRYLTVMLLVGILAPIIGMLAGALVESKIFTSSRDALLSNAKTEIAAQVESAKIEADKAQDRIRSASDEARGYLDQIRSTRAALDFVLQGTTIGEKTLLQERATEVQKDIDDFRKALTEWENKVKNDFPNGIATLNSSADSLRQLQESVQKLKKLFDETPEAGALAGAFYKIYEFLGELDVALYVSPQIFPPDFKTLVEAQSKITGSVAFFRADMAQDKYILEWGQFRQPLRP